LYLYRSNIYRDSNYTRHSSLLLFEMGIIMKNLRSNVLRLLAITLALSSAPIRAEKNSEIDNDIGLNKAEIKVVGEGAIRKNVFGVIGESRFVLRSSPIESNAEVRIYRNNDNYDILTCRTPCIFKLPRDSSFRFNVATPIGYSQTSKVPPIQWQIKSLTKNVIKPDDITFYFVQN